MSKNQDYSDSTIYKSSQIKEYILKNQAEFSKYQINIDNIDIPEDDIVELFRIFDKLYDFNKNNGFIDIIGVVYEGLSKNLGLNSVGEFFTPYEVADLMMRIAAPESGMSLYDPSLGTGRLLLNKYSMTLDNIDYYGQEVNQTLLNIARMNLLLNKISDYKLYEGDTLVNPVFTRDSNLLQFDRILANPPFSIPYAIETIKNYDRFVYNNHFKSFIPSHLLFLQHIIASLNKSKGKAVIVLPIEFLFKHDIHHYFRSRLIQDGLVKAIIKLPQFIFQNTRVAACLVVIDKHNSASRQHVHLINAENMCDTLSESKLCLTTRHVAEIFDIYNNNEEIQGISCYAHKSHIKAKRYNLNPTTYLSSNDSVDIKAFISGGIPKKEVISKDNLFSIFEISLSCIFTDKNLEYYSFKLDITTKDQLKELIFEQPGFISIKHSLISTLQAFHKDFKKNVSIDSNTSNIEFLLINTLLPILITFKQFKRHELIGVIAYTCQNLNEKIYEAKLNLKNFIENTEKTTKLKEADIIIKKRQFNTDLQQDFYNVLESVVIKELDNKLQELFRFLTDLWDKYHENIRYLEEEREYATSKLFRELKQMGLMFND